MWLIVGAGAIGATLAGRLAAAGQPVAITARPAQLEVIARRGVTITEPGGGQWTAHPAVTALAGSGDRARRLPGAPAARPALAVICVKAHATEEVAARLAAAFGPDLPVLSLQNGLGSEEILARRFRSVAGGAVTFSARRLAPGRVRVYSRGGAALPVALWDGRPTPPAVNDFAAALAGAGLRVRRPAASRDIKWSKLLLNLVGNGGVALTGLAPGAFYADPDGFALERAVMREALAAAAAHRRRLVGLPGMPVPLIAWLVARAPRRLAQPLLAARVGGGRGDKTPSLLADLEAGAASSEAPWLYGAVARFADEAGLAAPVNQKLAALLDRAFRGDPAVARFRGRPDLLARAVLPAAR